MNLVEPGRLLAASTVPYVEDQDHWWLSGIHRDVVVYTKESAHIADYRVVRAAPGWGAEVQADPGLKASTTHFFSKFDS